MSMSNAWEQKVLRAVLQGIDLDFRVGANLYLALFTSDPTETGSFANEATYVGYARASLPKASSWVDGVSTFTNSGLIQFAQCTGGSNTITHFAVCEESSGGTLGISGALNAPLNISSGIQPQFSTSSLSIGAD